MIATMVVLAAAAAVSQATPTPPPRGAAAAAVTMGKATATPPRGKTLGEVARGIKLQFPKGESKVITNENLRSLAGGAELTMAAAAPDAAPGARDAASPSESEEARKKTLWQERFFSAQQDVKRLEAEEATLSQEIARLEREFYARDDPYQRDAVIKPAWDEALARLREIQGLLPAARRAPDEIANTARREGALPGWFREAPPATPAPDGSGRPQH